MYFLTFQITSDKVGFGFVIRGDGPCYIQAIDPAGPAASAGLKVNHYYHYHLLDYYSVVINFPIFIVVRKKSKTICY